MLLHGCRELSNEHASRHRSHAGLGMLHNFVYLNQCICKVAIYTPINIYIYIYIYICTNTNDSYHCPHVGKHAKWQSFFL